MLSEIWTVDRGYFHWFHVRSSDDAHIGQCDFSRSSMSQYFLECYIVGTCHVFSNN